MTIPRELSQLPPSAKLVYQTLAHHEPLTYSSLRTETELSDSTLSFALSELETRGVLESDDGEYRLPQRR